MKIGFCFQTSSGTSRPPFRHFERSREILLAPRSFWLLSWKYSHFPLSYLRRHTGVQDRSLDFVRDDVTRISLFSHLMTARSAIHIRGASYFYAPPPSFLIPNSSFLIYAKLSSPIKGQHAPRANTEPLTTSMPSIHWFSIAHHAFLIIIYFSDLEYFRWSESRRDAEKSRGKCIALYGLINSRLCKCKMKAEMARHYIPFPFIDSYGNIR